MAHAAINGNAAGATIDFGLAEHFLETARLALESGNQREFEAARIMVALSLGIEMTEPAGQRLARQRK